MTNRDLISCFFFLCSNLMIEHRPVSKGVAAATYVMQASKTDQTILIPSKRDQNYFNSITTRAFLHTHACIGSKQGNIQYMLCGSMTTRQQELLLPSITLLVSFYIAICSRMLKILMLLSSNLLYAYDLGGTYGICWVLLLRLMTCRLRRANNFDYRPLGHADAFGSSLFGHASYSDSATPTPSTAACSVMPNTLTRPRRRL